MPDLLAARAQMGTSLAFHIIFSALALICIVLRGSAFIFRTHAIDPKAPTTTR
ncbi:MAG TPA: hypothetical protein VE843_18475 [Ktedonobacteraceae bacterium]|nr:hypothetical protein [Ktedonobacteraceae bacterium]